MLLQLAMTLSSENEAVTRGIKAVMMIFQLTNRVPDLIKQSHLERKEGALFYSLPLQSPSLTLQHGAHTGPRYSELCKPSVSIRAATSGTRHSLACNVRYSFLDLRLLIIRNGLQYSEKSCFP